MLPAVSHRAAAQTRRRLRAGHRAEPIALQVSLLSSPRALPCLAVESFLCSTCVAELRFAAGTHTAEHAPSSQGPAFLWPGVVRAQTLVEHMLSALCHRHGCAADILPAHTNTGSRPCSSWSNRARALTRTRGRSPAYVPNQRRRAVPRRSPLFVPLPSARHQFRVAAMAVPSAFGTHTNARNRGAEPLLHLSVTVLDLPPFRHREPLRTGARLSVEPSTPISNLLATLTLNTASPKSARRALVSVSSPCTCRRFRVAPVARPPTSAQMRTHTPEGSNPSALPVQPHTYPCAHSRSIPARIRVILTDATQEYCVGEPHLAPILAVVSPHSAALHLVSQLHNTHVARTTPLCLSGEPLMLYSHAGTRTSRSAATPALCPPSGISVSRSSRDLVAVG
jgi:hypothetical protein